MIDKMIKKIDIINIKNKIVVFSIQKTPGGHFLAILI